MGLIADQAGDRPPNLVSSLGSGIGRVLIALAVPLVAFIVLWQGFLFLRDGDAPKEVIAAVAIVWGVGGVGLLYVVSNWVLEQLPERWRGTFVPYLFVGPAIAILGAYLLVPTLLTLLYSFMNRDSSQFVGVDNYLFALTDPVMIEAFRNNVLWMVLGTGLSVSLGLVIAVLADRSGFERVAKALIFLPLAISFVGSSIIWRFVYAFRPEGQEQIGLLNAIWTAFGGSPQAWILSDPLNTVMLIIILVWMQTGFAMVILSAALKGVPDELLEAARIDGASELQIFFRVIIPVIQGAIITVATTILILTLKIYDIVKAMTNGNFGTNVIATLQFDQLFTFANNGRGAALAIILLLAVTPIIWYNLRQFRRREAF